MSEGLAIAADAARAAAPRRGLLVPTAGALALATAVLALAVLASFAPRWHLAWLAAGVLAAGLLALDALLLGRRAPPQVRRRHAHALSLGVDSDVSLELQAGDAGALRLRLFDHVPDTAEVSGLPQPVRLAAGQRVTLHYRLRPLRRGELRFGAVELRLASPLRLWERRLDAGAPSAVRVYPNFSALVRYALLATDHRLSQLGVLQRRRRGEGLEFQQLREYRQGDTPRQIDWKASARVRRLVSREYRDERDQQVLLLLDCGRRMHARDGALSHLDHALNACLLLAHVALRQGDAVGLMSFGGVERYVPPRKSHAALNALLAASYDLDVTLHAPDYYAAAVDLLRRQSKRSLVVIVSNLRDEDDDSLRPALALLRRRHLVVLASLREHILDAALAAPVDGLDAALTHAATAQYLERRRRQFALLEESRVPCLDVEPQQLPIALVNRYTELKRRGAL